MKLLGFLIAAFSAFISSGCLLDVDSSDPDTGENVASAESKLEEANAISMNALSLDALNLNTLSLSALNIAVLNPSALAALQDPGTNGALARQFVRYAVSCALTPSQSFEYSWTDSESVTHQETEAGSLGLASSWDTVALSLTAQKWVSACVIARVNRYDISVMVSLRAGFSGFSLTSTTEQTNYSVLEGAFWGNLFGLTPSAHACYYEPNIEAARTRSRACAAGHVDPTLGVLECGMIDIIGSCEDYCDPLHSIGSYYPECGVSPLFQTSSVITVWLQ